MQANEPIWSNLTPEEHEFQYNPQRAFPDFETARLTRQPANDAARADLEVSADIAYGDHPLRKLDIYPAAPSGTPAPVHIFLHGGYWRAQDKANYAFTAGILVPRGITTVIVNYELCPDSTLDGVVDSAIAATRWIFANIQDYGSDPNHITLSGHSAGAHLGAAIMAHDWPAADRDRLRGAVLTSGIYDPAPAMGTSVNQQLNLSRELALRHNVEARPAVLKPDLAIVVGGREPWQWVDQSFRYYRNRRMQEMEPALHVLPGRNHFDILDEYLDADSITVRTILQHCARNEETNR
ncbi:alpha/beta hydrolase [Microbaculum marinisediminis]|uniref:Alpha/beta hydrolase n=1 Tax=Microbaculum marinisediminis TaxID=2931392 RepID=A0AAW5R6M3_9HYPH|nr:alpha/beta hydrolase [Microbaculum sp. A6E488]MCT8974284.1 alpha/beta hydrolase [Microbaculum sp. A6E488]